MQRLLVTALACLISVSVYGQEAIKTDTLDADSYEESFKANVHENAIIAKWSGVVVSSLGTFMISNEKEETRRLGSVFTVFGGALTIVSTLIQDIQAIRLGKEFKPPEITNKKNIKADLYVKKISNFNHGVIHSIRREPILFNVIEFGVIDGEKRMLISCPSKRYGTEEIWIEYEQYKIEWLDLNKHNECIRFFENN